MIEVKKCIIKGEADGYSFEQLLTGMDSGKMSRDIGKMLLKSFEAVGIFATTDLVI